MKSVAARGRASSNRASYGGAGLWAVWAEPPSSVDGGGGLKQSEMEQGGGRRAEPDEASLRTGVEVRTGCWDVTSGDTQRGRWFSVGRIERSPAQVINLIN